MPYIYESAKPLTEYEARAALDQTSGLDYLAETELTASGVFTPENVGIIEFTSCLAAVIHASQEMDKFKKALFRKRTREESGLPPMETIDTDLWQALAGIGIQRGDPIGQEIVDKYDRLFHGIVGLITETGEMAEVLLYFLDRNQEPDPVNVREELGDLLWYEAQLVKWADTTFLTEMQRNIGKLRLRHGNAGFDKGRDIERDLDSERALLEGHEMTEEEAEMYAKDEEAHPEDYQPS